MPITLLTTLIIATRPDIQITSAGPVDGKYIGWITLGPEDCYRPLLDSGPRYDSHEAAMAGMREFVGDMKRLVAGELIPPR
jgi:hypothetical protein